MIHQEINSCGVSHRYFTTSIDNMSSCVITLTQGSVLPTDHNYRYDLYVVEGVVSWKGQLFYSGTYLSLSYQEKVFAISDLVKLFCYKEEIQEDDFEIVILPSDQIWSYNSVKGLKQCLLRNYKHVLYLVFWEPETVIPYHEHIKGEEIFVLEGELLDRNSSLKKGGWIRMLAGEGHAPHTKVQTLILLRNGHV